MPAGRFPPSGYSDQNEGAARVNLYAFCVDQVAQQIQQNNVFNSTNSTINNDSSSSSSSADAIMQCIAEQLQDQVGAREFSRSVLLVYAAALVFFMQAGFAMVCAGAVRKKNVQNTMLKNLLDACGAALAFFTVGYAFAFGGGDPTSAQKTFMGTSNFFLMGVEDLAFWIFEYAFSAASATIVAGTLAERCQMAAYLCYSVMLTGWVYPIIAHAIWSPNGFLSAYNIEPLWGVGMIDFAGSGVVHCTGGVTALIATIILGPRRGRFHDETGRRLEVPREFPGHSMALQMLGTFILWFGWYGFNAGSALLSPRTAAADVAALAAVNTTLAAGTAGIVALFLNLFVLERVTGEPFFDVKYAMNGSLCGLVSITAGCGVFEPWAAVVTGFIAGCLYLVGSRGLIKLRLDDAVDAIPVHFLNGMWGLFAVGLFASPSRLWDAYRRNDHPGLFYTWWAGYSDATLLGIQMVGLLFILGWVLVFMFPFFVWLDWRGWFRSDPLEEIVGLDTSYHGGLFLMNHGDGGDEINPEYISAYKQKREGLRRRKVTAHSSNEISQASTMSHHNNNNNNNMSNYSMGRNNGSTNMMVISGVSNGNPHGGDPMTMSGSSTRSSGNPMMIMGIDTSTDNNMIDTSADNNHITIDMRNDNDIIMPQGGNANPMIMSGANANSMIMVQPGDGEQRQMMVINTNDEVEGGNNVQHDYHANSSLQESAYQDEQVLDRHGLDLEESISESNSSESTHERTVHL